MAILALPPSLGSCQCSQVGNSPGSAEEPQRQRHIGMRPGGIIAAPAYARGEGRGKCGPDLAPASAYRCASGHYWAFGPWDLSRLPWAVSVGGSRGSGRVPGGDLTRVRADLGRVSAATERR